MIRLSLRVCAVVFFVALIPVGAQATPLEPDELPKVDRIVVWKSKRELDLMLKGIVIRAYPIALGSHPVGAKRRKGDGRTPEGVYIIDGRTRRTAYHRALHISYPGETQRTAALARGANPGGDIFIHGMPASFGRKDPVRFFVDWTNGCIAVGNIAIEEIWNAVDDGTVVEIHP
ncbi:L,D-transpeptidase family protein [Parvibaculum sp.]|uniref:L,D-transpeptidase family protein n=1 Tax=Parvibaculum sp. TaxID=2024848 RepID=UPI002BD77C0B|nr:L,D-transpeptidase family protein [Parvibaculum sp.]HUD51370.1 L,D-transpeptidase family protein [Parvibaculum sp.]